MKKEIDKSLSAMILVAFMVIWGIYWIVAKVPDVPGDVIKGVGIARDIIQCLMFLVVLYNALGWTKNGIIKLAFVAVALFLIFCVVAQYLPPDSTLNLPVPYLY